MCRLIKGLGYLVSRQTTRKTRLVRNDDIKRSVEGNQRVGLAGVTVPTLQEREDKGG